MSVQAKYGLHDVLSKMFGMGYCSPINVVHMNFEQQQHSADELSPDQVIPSHEIPDQAITYTESDVPDSENDISGMSPTEFGIGGELANTEPYFDDEPITYPDDPYDSDKESDVSAEQPPADETASFAAAHEAAGEESSGKRLRITKIVRPLENDPSTNRVDAGKVVQACLNGETQELEVIRMTDTGETVFAVPDSLRPRGAAAREVPESVTSEEGEDRLFKAWTRIKRVPHAPAEDGNLSPKREDEENGVIVENVLSDHKGPIKVVVHGGAVDPEAVSEMKDEVADMHYDADKTTGKEREARALGVVLETLSRGQDSGLVHQEVVIGAPDEESVRKAAVAAVRSMLPTNEVTWHIDTNKGRMKVYGSKEDAIKAGEKDLNSYVTAEDFAEMIRFPDKEVNGLSLADKYKFAVNRDVGDQRCINVGTIEDNDGNEAGEFPMPIMHLLRHTLIIGNTGSAKTFETREIVSKAVGETARMLLSGELGDDGRPLKIVVIDQKKTGNYSQVLADQIAGQLQDIPGMTPELLERLSTVNAIRPGEAGMRPILDIFNPAGGSVKQQVDIAINALTLGISADPEGQRMLTRYVGDGVRLAYKMLGWNLETDGSDYPNGMPAVPTMAFVVKCIRNALSEGSYEGKVQGNIGEFAAGQIESDLSGIAGDLLQCGHPIDMRKVFDDPGVTVFDLDMIERLGVKTIATASIFRELIKTLDAENLERGIQSAKHPRLLVIIDEAGSTFTKSEAGEANAEKLTYIREKGAGVVIALQQGLDVMHEAAIGNLRTKIAMFVERQEDRNILANGMGSTPVEELDYLVSPEMTQGKALVYGEGMSGPIRTITTHPDKIKKGEGTVKDGRDLVNLGAYPEHYDGDVMVKAQELLRKTDVGSMIRAWAETSVYNVGFERMPVELPDIVARNGRVISGAFKYKLQNMKTLDPRIRDSAIVAAVTAAVDSRPQLMHQAARAEYSRRIADHLLAQVHDDREMPDDNFLDLALNAGRFNRIIDELRTPGRLTARRLPNTQRYTKILGQIGGETAEEQMENLDKREKISREAIADTLEKLSKGDMASTDAAEVVAQEMKKLTVGIESDEKELKKLDNLIRASLARRKVEITVEEVLKDAGPTAEASAIRITAGFPQMRKELEAAITEAKVAPGLTDSEIDKWQELYGDDLSELRGLSAQDQYDALLAMQKLHVLRTGYTVNNMDMLFAPDLIDGGLTLDNIGAAMVRHAEPQGRLVDAQRRSLNDGQPEDLSIVKLVEKDDPKLSDSRRWSDTLGRRVIYNNSDLRMSWNGRRNLVQQVNAYVRLLRHNANKQRETKSRNALQQKRKP